MKRAIGTIIFFVILVLGGGTVWVLSEPYDRASDLWLSSNYSIANNKSGSYVPIKKYESPEETHYEISLAAYRGLFPRTESEITVTEDGMVYYKSTGPGPKVSATTWVGGYSILHDTKVTSVSDEGHIEFVQVRDRIMVFMFLIAVFAIAFCLAVIIFSIPSSDSK